MIDCAKAWKLKKSMLKSLDTRRTEEGYIKSLQMRESMHKTRRILARNQAEAEMRTQRQLAKADADNKVQQYYQALNDLKATATMKFHEFEHAKSQSDLCESSRKQTVSLPNNYV